MAVEEFESTALMTNAALGCRERGRHRFPGFLDRAGRIVADRKAGRASSVFTGECEEGCGVVEIIEIALGTLETVSRRLEYPKDTDGIPMYLVPKEFAGQGRFARTELRHAVLARVSRNGTRPRLRPDRRTAK